MKSTVLTVTQTGPQTSNILIDSTYAHSLHEFLKQKDIQVSPIEDAIFETLRAYIDSDGKKQVETKTIDMSFAAHASSAQLEALLNDWSLSAKEL